MNTKLKILCRIVSLLGLACSGFCFWYVVAVAYRILSSPPREDMPPRFTEWYIGLSLVAVTLAIGAVLGSIDLARLRIRGVRLLTIFSFLPIPLMMILGVSWLSPMGKSIAAATGLGIGGLMPMLFSLLPLWAGLLWIFAFRSDDTLRRSYA